jgi:hypothetical protein
LTLPDQAATEIYPAQLTGGFTNSYFITGQDGAMVFVCPVTGGTTSGSDYPRSELLEMLDPTNNGVNWIGPGRHILNAQCRVLRVASSKWVIIGQIHSYLGSAPPLVKLQYNDGQVDALVKTNSTMINDLRVTFGYVGLSNNINYQIKFVDGFLDMTVNGINRSLNMFQSDPGWMNQRYYFKAGNYCQDNSGSSNEQSIVSFYDLITEHKPPCCITNSTVTASNVSLTWTSLPGSWYYVQGANSLTSPAWLTLSPTMTATGYAASYQVPLPSSYRFFRIGVKVPHTPPVLTCAAVTNGLLVKWQSSAAARFQVQWSSTLPPSWSSFTNTMTSANGAFSFLDNGAQAGGLGLRRFYRVVEVP